MAKALIPPSVGRKVWYRPSPWDKSGPGGMQAQTGQPLDATIVAVNSETNVNLVVFDAAGYQHRRTSVTLMHDTEGIQGMQSGPGPGYAEWMPYQIGQAKKHEHDETDAVPA